MELPLWLSKGLYERKRKVLSVELPKVFKEGWRTVFMADPNVVDLHKMGPYYYGLGSQMLHFDNPENPDIAKTLLQVKRVGGTTVGIGIDQFKKKNNPVDNNSICKCTQIRRQFL